MDNPQRYEEYSDTALSKCEGCELCQELNLRPPCAYGYPDGLFELERLSEPNHSNRTTAPNTLGLGLGLELVHIHSLDLAPVRCRHLGHTADGQSQAEPGKHMAEMGTHIHCLVAAEMLRFQLRSVDLHGVEGWARLAGHMDLAGHMHREVAGQCQQQLHQNNTDHEGRPRLDSLEQSSQTIAVALVGERTDQKHRGPRPAEELDILNLYVPKGESDHGQLRDCLPV
jgi:hypothetical protein